MRVGIWTNLFASLFRVLVHGTMRCGGRDIQEVIFYFVQKDKLVL